MLLNITPKPLNWDLKRDIAPALSTLQARTQRKIRELIAKQIEEQKQMADSSDESSDEDDSSSEEEKENK